MSTTKVGADLLVERLLDWGVDTIFGLPGDGINGFMEALRKHQDRIRYIHVRHEEVAAMAAVGYAKFTGRLGVCFSTAGPGAIHMMNGLLDAHLASSDNAAIGGDLANYYSQFGSLSGMALAAAQQALKDPAFGAAAQVVHSNSQLQQGAVSLV